MLNIKHRDISFLFLALIAAGCTTTIDPQYHLDAVQRALDGPFYWLPVSGNELENGQNFDVAVALFRLQGLDGGITSSVGRMAFERNGTPLQVDSALINGAALMWNAPPTGSEYGNEYTYSSDSILTGGSDTMTFEYKNMDGESFAQTVGGVPSFGKMIFPETIASSQGFHITYQNSIPNDSIRILITADSAVWLMKPDTGTIVVAPGELPPANGFCIVTCFRWNWTTRTSPSGKRIGIYSSIQTPEQFIQLKP